MPTLTIEYQTDAERLVLEQAIAYVRGLNQLAQTAAHGTVLAVCEQLALSDGRKLLRVDGARRLEPRVDRVEQGRAHGRVLALGLRERRDQRDQRERRGESIDQAPYPHGIK